MIRIYEEFARKMLMMLTLVRSVDRDGKIEARYLAQKVRELGMEVWGHNDGVNPNVITEIDTATRFCNSRTTLDEMINELGEQLYERRQLGHKGEQTLIDVMVDALQLDKAGAIVGNSRSLTALRAGLLKPSELAQVERRLRTRTMSCANCNRDLTNGEGVSVYFNDNGESTIYCYTCQHPDHVRCAVRECEEPAYFAPSALTGETHYCEAHRIDKGLNKKKLKTPRLAEAAPVFDEVAVGLTAAEVARRLNDANQPVAARRVAPGGRNLFREWTVGPPAPVNTARIDIPTVAIDPPRFVVADETAVFPPDDGPF